MKTLILAALLLVSAGCEAKPKFTVDQCEHMQSEATREFVKFCIAHGKSGPRLEEPCIVGQERVKQADLIASGGVTSMYLEVYDCSWHRGTNPRSK